MKEIFWKNIDFCRDCGGCSIKETSKMIFGKEINNICRTTFKFINPGIEELECMKKMVEIKKIFSIKSKMIKNVMYFIF
jgi:hypothetical protein